MVNEQMRNASREVWDAMAAGWDARQAWFEEMARPVTTTMLERAAVQAGDRVLDLASGTGVAGLAAAPLVGGEGRVILSDFAPSMVGSARRQVERLGLDNVECRLLDAEQLDLPDDDVDAVLCREAAERGEKQEDEPPQAVVVTARRRPPGENGRSECE